MAPATYLLYSQITRVSETIKFSDPCRVKFKSELLFFSLFRNNRKSTTMIELPLALKRIGIALCFLLSRSSLPYAKLQSPAVGGISISSRRNLVQTALLSTLIASEGAGGNAAGDARKGKNHVVAQQVQDAPGNNAVSTTVSVTPARRREVRSLLVQKIGEQGAAAAFQKKRGRSDIVRREKEVAQTVGRVREGLL